MNVEIYHWTGSDDKAVGRTKEGAIAAVRYGQEVVTVDAVMERLNRQEQGDDLPILLEDFGCFYPVVVAAIMDRDFDKAIQMLQEAVAPPSKPQVFPEKEHSDSVVLVELDQMPGFQKRLESLNKKAAAFGLDPIKIVASEDKLYERKYEYIGRDYDKLLTTLEPVHKGSRAEHPVLLKRIQIEYPEVKLGHWQVIGKLEAVEGGNLTFAITQAPQDVDALTQRAEHPIACEHCQTKRYRKESYLLRDRESGEYKQVGNSCLEDFTGIDPAAALFLARMSDIVKITEDELEEYGRSGRCNAVDTRHYLAKVSFVAENLVFVSSTKARETGQLATFRQAISLNNLLQNDRTLQERFASQWERHLSTADAVREWFATKPEESSFDRNLKLLLQSEAIALENKHLAFAAAAVPVYTRALEMKKAAQEKPSEHVGVAGQKLTSIVSVERVIPIETPYGVTDLVLMKDQAGNKLKWKTSACPHEIRKEGVGRSLEASFKVKEHDTYKDQAQTAVTHLKVLRWLEPTSAPVTPLEEESSTVDPAYRISIFQHEEGQVRNYETPVLDSQMLTQADFLAAASERSIDQFCQEEDLVWYAPSAPDSQGRSYSLFIHDIDGRIPTEMDYQKVLTEFRRHANAAFEVPEATALLATH